MGALQRVETGASPLPESVSSVSRGAATRNASTSAPTLDSSISLSLRISYMSFMRTPMKNQKSRAGPATVSVAVAYQQPDVTLRSPILNPP